MRLDKKDMVLYAVTDRHWLNGESLYSQVEKALKGGATFIQLREKNLGEEEFLAEAKEIARLCKSYHVPFVINDNVEIAKKVDADGVHVGQSDMEALDVRKTLGEDKIIGYVSDSVLSDTEIVNKFTDTVTAAQDSDILDYPGKKDGEVVGEVLQDDELKSID